MYWLSLETSMKLRLVCLINRSVYQAYILIFHRWLVTSITPLLHFWTKSFKRFGAAQDIS